MSLNDRVARLRQRSFEAEPSISTERAELMTRFYRENEGRHPVPVLRALAFYDLCDKKTIYIKKSRDSGNAPYKLLPRPKEHRGDKLPFFETSTATGSAADVAAKGHWTAGHWQLEFARALVTGNADDAAFKPGQKILGQIAVFNQGYAEHKSVSELLLFDFSAIK